MSREQKFITDCQQHMNKHATSFQQYSNSHGAFCEITIQYNIISDLYVWNGSTTYILKTLIESHSY